MKTLGADELSFLLQIEQCCRNPLDFQIVCVSKSIPELKYKKATQWREPCPPPPPPLPPPPRDDRLLWGTLAIAMLAGGFAVYAKRSPEIRDWITIYAPWFDDFIAVAYEENMSYGEYITMRIEELRKHFSDEEPPKPKPCAIDGTPIPTVPEGPKKAIIKTADGVEEPCDLLKPPIVTKDICEIEKCLKDLGDAAMNNYITAKDACVYYNKLVQDTMQDFSMAAVKELEEAKAERLDLVSVSVENAQCASNKLDELTRYFDCGVKAKKEQIDSTKCMLKEYQDKIKAALIEYTWENDKSVVLDTHWQKVVALVDKYVDENQTMFNGLKYDQKKPSLPGDADLLLYHTFRYVKQLETELEEAVAGMTERVNRGIDMLPQGEKETKARCALIQATYNKKKAELDKEFAKRCENQRIENEKVKKEAIRNQLCRHNETLQVRLVEKEKEATEKLNRMVAEKVAYEKKMMKNQLAEMAAKLKLVEDKLNAHLKAERETRRSQELWTAGASLLAATKKGEPYVMVDRELKAIEKAAGEGDQLVETVLKAIPKSVRERGLVPESILRQKYHKMEKTALKVALVEQDGAPLPVYFLSWLQSALLFMKLSGIPQKEYDKPPKEPPSDLDTFDLLQRARFWIERGNIAAALRYVSWLEGASRAAAATWHEAARAHVETRQAAEAVLAHAAALGLQYI